MNFKILLPERPVGEMEGRLLGKTAVCVQVLVEEILVRALTGYLS